LGHYDRRLDLYDRREKHKINAKKNRSIKPVNKMQDLKLSYDELQKFIKLKERVQKIADKNKT